MRSSVNASPTWKLPAIAGVGPPAPAALPLCESSSGRKFAASERYSAPTLTCRPELAVGICTPYLPISPVIEPSATYSVTVASTSSGTDRYWSEAGDTPPGAQMFHGTHLVSEPFSTERQVGAPPTGFGTTCSALMIFALDR